MNAFKKWALAGAAVLALGGAPQAADVIKMATIAPGTSAYLTQSTMASIVNQEQDDYEIQVDATGAATKHIIDMAEGELDMVMTSPEYMEFLDNLDSTVWATDNRLVFSANLTPDDETGIGTWTEEDFIATIRSGRHQGVGKRLKYPMPWQELAALNDEELAALFAYLRTMKPINNKVPDSVVLFR